MIRPFGRQGPAATLRQHCPQMARRPCSSTLPASQAKQPNFPLGLKCVLPPSLSLSFIEHQTNNQIRNARLNQFSMDRPCRRRPRVGGHSYMMVALWVRGISPKADNSTDRLRDSGGVGSKSKKNADIIYVNSPRRRASGSMGTQVSS